MVRHAHAREDKEARRDDILRAALTLFLEDMRRFPAVAAIAAKAGLAKGTVYLYFQTKEQIFTALLSREWHALLSHIEDGFADGDVDRSKMVAQFIDRFATFLDSHAYFLRLDSLGYGLLEANLSPDEFWRFKSEFSMALNRAGRIVDTGLSLSAGHGMRLLVRSYALTKGLWQTLDFPDWLRGEGRLADHPLADMSFDTELRTALTEFWRGGLGET